MAWTIKKALKDDHILEPLKLVSEYEFIVGKLSTPIKVKIFSIVNSVRFLFRQSHFIHTPVQADPYMTSRIIEDSEAYALHRVVDSIISHYKEAVNNGHEPEESWLVVNGHYS